MNRFLKEINEQPQALNDTLEYLNGNEVKALLAKTKDLWDSENYDHILFTGMGSSYFAGYYASCLLSNDGIPSFVINAGELLHYHFKLLNKKSLLICVSQSGESYEVVKILDNLPDEVTSIGITNEEKSSVAQKSSLILFSRAGREEMTSTKTYVSTLLVLRFLRQALSGQWNDAGLSELASLTSTTESLIDEMPGKLKDIMNFLDRPSYIQLIGRGPSFASVMQGALMFREGARTPAAGTLGGEFRHGPMEMVKEGFAAIILGPDGASYNQSIKLAGDIVRFGGKVLFITNRKPEIDNKNILYIVIPCKEEYLFPIHAIVPLQYMVNYWAESEGNEPGDFTRGAKVTTSE